MASTPDTTAPDQKIDTTGTWTTDGSRESASPLSQRRGGADPAPPGDITVGAYTPDYPRTDSERPGLRRCQERRNGCAADGRRCPARCRPSRVRSVRREDADRMDGHLWRHRPGDSRRCGCQPVQHGGEPDHQLPAECRGAQARPRCSGDVAVRRTLVRPRSTRPWRRPAGVRRCECVHGSVRQRARCVHGRAEHERLEPRGRSCLRGPFAVAEPVDFVTLASMRAEEQSQGLGAEIALERAESRSRAETTVGPLARSPLEASMVNVPSRSVMVSLFTYFLLTPSAHHRGLRRSQVAPAVNAPPLLQGEGDLQ
jgi:hypothetical protein